MARVLAGCHSFTLIKPGAGEKITIKRGQSIDHLGKEEQAYLRRQTITPPSSDDSHVAPMRAPVFQEAMDEDVKGEAQVEPFNIAAGAGNGAPQGGRSVEPVQVQVVVSKDAAAAGVSASVDEADEDDDDGAAAGGDVDDGDDEGEAEEAAPAPKAKAAPKGKAQGKAKS